MKMENSETNKHKKSSCDNLRSENTNFVSNKDSLSRKKKSFLKKFSAVNSSNIKSRIKKLQQTEKKYKRSYDDSATSIYKPNLSYAQPKSKRPKHTTSEDDSWMQDWNGQYDADMYNYPVCNPSQFYSTNFRSGSLPNNYFTPPPNRFAFPPYRFYSGGVYRGNANAYRNKKLFENRKYIKSSSSKSTPPVTNSEDRLRTVKDDEEEDKTIKIDAECLRKKEVSDKVEMLRSILQHKPEDGGDKNKVFVDESKNIKKDIEPSSGCNGRDFFFPLHILSPVIHFGGRDVISLNRDEFRELGRFVPSCNEEKQKSNTAASCNDEGQQNTAVASNKSLRSSSDSETNCVSDKRSEVSSQLKGSADISNGDDDIIEVPVAAKPSPPIIDLEPIETSRSPSDLKVNNADPLLLVDKLHSLKKLEDEEAKLMNEISNIETVWSNLFIKLKDIHKVRSLLLNQDYTSY